MPSSPMVLYNSLSIRPAWSNSRARGGELFLDELAYRIPKQLVLRGVEQVG